jgi:hypothetical protein
MSNEYIFIPKSRLKRDIKVGELVFADDIVQETTMDEKQLQKEIIKIVNKYAKSPDKKIDVKKRLFFDIYRAFCVHFKMKEEINNG